MKVLSVRQAFAALLVLGVKRLEARGKNTTHRGPLLIHASSAAVTSTVIERLEGSRPVMELLQRLGWTSDNALRSLPRSAIIGRVNLIDSVPSDDLDDATTIDYDLSADPTSEVVYWVVKGALACEPVTVDGKLNIWDLPVDLESKVSVALTNGEAKRPDWTNPASGGRRVNLREYRPLPQLASVVGDKPRTLAEILFDLQKFADARGLISPTRLRLDGELGFLSPDRKFLKNVDVYEAVSEHIQLVESAAIDTVTAAAVPRGDGAPAPTLTTEPAEPRRGLRNSSSTRVAPIFDELLAAGQKHQKWINRLLGLASASDLPTQFGNLDLSLIEGYWGERERGLQPPVALLSWLIRNLAPEADALVGDGEVLDKRRKLAGRDPQAVEEALSLLRSGGSRKAWYVLEGPTVPDAFLVTPDALVVVEGKRTESGATTSTRWMQRRHQMLRHIDAAWEIRGHRRVFGLMIVEGNTLADPCVVPPEWSRAVALETDPLTIASSLPHRGPEEQRAIANAFLGATTWHAVAREFELPDTVLPNTVDQIHAISELTA